MTERAALVDASGPLYGMDCDGLRITAAETAVLPLKAAIYARMSIANGSQTCEDQLLEPRRYCEARGWTAFKEYLDEAISGSKDRRPALDEMLKSGRRRRFDVVICWRLDRLGRRLRRLVTLIEELQEVGVSFVSLNEGIDLATPAGRLQLYILAALSEFERARIEERVREGFARARAHGVRFGRPRVRIAGHALATVERLTVSEAAHRLGVSRSTAHRMMVRGP